MQTCRNPTGQCSSQILALEGKQNDNLTEKQQQKHFFLIQKGVLGFRQIATVRDIVV